MVLRCLHVSLPWGRRPSARSVFERALPLTRRPLLCQRGKDKGNHTGVNELFSQWLERSGDALHRVVWVTAFWLDEHELTRTRILLLLDFFFYILHFLQKFYVNLFFPTCMTLLMSTFFPLARTRWLPLGSLSDLSRFNFNSLLFVLALWTLRYYFVEWKYFFF